MRFSETYIIYTSRKLHPCWPKQIVMKKVLVATDFSACANNAMEYAMELAKSLGLQVHAKW